MQYLFSCLNINIIKIFWWPQNWKILQGNLTILHMNLDADTDLAVLWTSQFTRVLHKKLGGCMHVTENLRHVLLKSSFKVVPRIVCLSSTLW